MIGRTVEETSSQGADPKVCEELEPANNPMNSLEMANSLNLHRDFELPAKLPKFLTSKMWDNGFS